MNSTLPLMMKLILSLTVIWAFTSTAGAIMCKRCMDFTDPTCATEDVDCSSDNACIVLYYTDASVTPAREAIYANCASDDVCQYPGLIEFAGTLGGASSHAYGLCCNTDLCNTGVTLPFPSIQGSNDYQCPGCDPPTTGCLETVPCLGRQDTCFSAFLTEDVAPSLVSGCATSNVCTAAVSLGFLPFFSQLGDVTIEPTCISAIPTTTTTTTTTTATVTTTETPSTPTPPVVPCDPNNPLAPNTYNYYNYYNSGCCSQHCRNRHNCQHHNRGFNNH